MTCSITKDVGSISLDDSTSSSGVVDSRLAQHLTLLHNVIRSRRWSAFDSIVLKNPKIFHMINDGLLNYETTASFSGMKSLLHACLRYDPPVAIVVKMLKLSPDLGRAALQVVDDCGRTPLHIAALCDADPMIIKVLSSADVSACSIQDMDGRTPLHLACDTSASIANDDQEAAEEQGKQRSTPRLGAIQALLSESLMPSLLEDDEGMSPLEYAIISDASIEVVNLLQKATIHSRELSEMEQKSMMDKKKRKLALDDEAITDEEANDCTVDKFGRLVQRRRVSY